MAAQQLVGGTTRQGRQRLQHSVRAPKPSPRKPRRTPLKPPFELTRCRNCKRAKQGAVFCRVVRMHRDDGWVAPEGFESWVREWEGETPRSWAPPRRERRDEPGWVWKRPDNDALVDEFLASVDAPEDEALHALYAANYDADVARRALPKRTEETPAVENGELASATQAFLSAVSLVADSEPWTPEHGGVRARRRKWTEDDVFTFGEALMESDRDCRAALKKVSCHPSFADATMGDCLDLYYGLFKPSAMYAQWKTPVEDPPEAGDDLVFACPCGCGAVVDNRGRPSSHRRKWATRSCRDRAARQSTTSDDDDDGREAPLVGTCLCGCGQTVDNRGKAASHRKKWASAACRQRAHSERAKEVRRERRTLLPCSSTKRGPPDTPPPHASKRPRAESRDLPSRRQYTLVHAGVMLASRLEDGELRAGHVVGRSRDGWRVQFGDHERDLSARAIAALVDDDNDTDPSSNVEHRYRGVTRKPSGDSARYAAAFSLLGDRFSLGAFDTALQAARAWDVVAWTAGRTDLNVLDFAGSPKSPSSDDLQVLAARLRENVRLRSCALATLKHQATHEVDAVPRRSDGNVVVVRSAKEEPRASTGGPLALLAGDTFTTALGAPLVVDGAVYVVTAQLSRRWLVDRVEADEDTAPKHRELTTADLEAAGAASFPLLATGLVDTKSIASLPPVLRFLEAQLVGHTLHDGRTITAITQQADRLVARLQTGDYLDLQACRRDLLAPPLIRPHLAQSHLPPALLA